MQSLKEDIRRKIISVAKKEFFTRDFSGANMRVIAKKCGISSGNIYNYFEGKDDIFNAIVAPTVKAVNAAFAAEDKRDYLKEPDAWSYEHHIGLVEVISEFVYTHRENLKLLAFHSHGAECDNFRESVIDRYTALSVRCINSLKKEFPKKSIELDDFFIHSIASFYVKSVEEALMHGLSFEEMKSYFNKLMKFSYYGWMQLMGDIDFVGA